LANAKSIPASRPTGLTARVFDYGQYPAFASQNQNIHKEIEMKLSDIKSKLYADTYSQKDGVFTVRRGFFYRMGKDVSHFKNDILATFPSAKIIDSGEVWKAFRGGSSVANSSHWFVKFTIE